MRRVWLCLPLCVCLGSDRPSENHPSRPSGAFVAFADEGKNNGALPSQNEMERLARTDPLAFLQAALRRYSRENIQRYTLTLHKQENTGGKLNPAEVVEVAFRAKPHSVFFKWVEGARLAERVLYVEGENDDKMLARPAGAIARLVAGDVVGRDVTGADARQSSRSTLDEFGLKKNLQRTIDAWKAARDAGALNVEYLGVKKLKELNDRPAWALHRTNKSAEDGVKESWFYVDTDTWFQAGIVQKDENGRLVASYWFRDIRLNPDFSKDQFTPAALKP
jgi:hypothetical protein